MKILWWSIWEVDIIDDSAYNLLIAMSGIEHLNCTINSLNCHIFPSLGREDLWLSYFYQGE